MQGPESLAAVERAIRENGGKPFRFGRGSAPCFWVPAASIAKIAHALRGADGDSASIELETILGARVMKEFLLTYVLRVGGRFEAFLRVTGSLESDWQSVTGVWRSARAEEEALSARFGMEFK